MTVKESAFASNKKHLKKCYLLFSHKDRTYAEKVTAFLSPLFESQNFSLKSKINLLPGDSTIFDYTDADAILLLLSIDYSIDEIVPFLAENGKRTIIIYIRHVSEILLADIEKRGVFIANKAPLSECNFLEKCLQYIEYDIVQFLLQKKGIANFQTARKQIVNKKTLSKLILINGIY